MKVIETTAPISIDNLKSYFIDKTISFKIDYANSQLKGDKLLTYLANVDIPADIAVTEDNEEFFPLLKTYFEFPFILSVATLEKAATQAILQKRGIIEPNEKFSKFIDDNLLIIEQWESILDSLTLYNFTILNVEDFNNFVQEFPKATFPETLTGINFVSLLKNEYFYDFYLASKKENVKNYESLFKDYIFKGKNLLAYWGVKQNPLFLLTYGIAEGLVEIGESGPVVKDISDLVT